MKSDIWIVFTIEDDRVTFSVATQKEEYARKIWREEAENYIKDSGEEYDIKISAASDIEISDLLDEIEFESGEPIPQIIGLTMEYKYSDPE